MSTLHDARTVWTASSLLLTLACLACGCAAPRTAPPPAMGDLSGAWLLETAGRPVRFIDDHGDTVSLTVSSEPLLLRQGQAVSDTSIAIDVAGLLVSGSVNVSDRMNVRSTEGEFVTAGPSAGTLRFRGPALSFVGQWSDRGFSGHFDVDRESAGKNARPLDSKEAWTLRRLGNQGSTSN